MTTCSCAATLEDVEGVKEFKGEETCKLFADFESKLGGKRTPLSPDSNAIKLERQPGPRTKLPMGSMRKRAPMRPRKYKGEVERDFAPCSAVEIKEASHSLTKKKAKGPDGFLAEVYQELPSAL